MNFSAEKLRKERYLLYNKPLRIAEYEIVLEKVKQGINGIEWLVLNCEPGAMGMLIFDEKLARRLLTTELIIDALLMDEQPFWEKHQIRWWPSLHDTILYLVLLKERNYDAYFRLLQDYFDQASK